MAIVYRNILEVVRLSAVVTPGLEALHASIGARDGIEILLVYHALHDPAISLSELADLVSMALLGLPMLLDDFNIHAEARFLDWLLSSWKPWLPWTCSNMLTAPPMWAVTFYNWCSPLSRVRVA